MKLILFLLLFFSTYHALKGFPVDGNVTQDAASTNITSPSQNALVHVRNSTYMPPLDNDTVVFLPTLRPNVPIPNAGLNLTEKLYILTVDGGNVSASKKLMEECLIKFGKFMANGTANFLYSTAITEKMVEFCTHSSILDIGNDIEALYAISYTYDIPALRAYLHRIEHVDMKDMLAGDKERKDRLEAPLPKEEFGPENSSKKNYHIFEALFVQLLLIVALV